MKSYQISFKAYKSSGELVREMVIIAGPFEEQAKVHICFLPLQRMCLEFARVNGVSCSYVEITDISEFN